MDVDQLGYEELLNMEERLGTVNVGMTKEMISKLDRKPLEDLLHK
jgi:hypothetical protein